MKHALSHALAPLAHDERATDRILAASFFRTRPLQAGTSPVVVDLADRRRQKMQHHKR